MPKSPLIVLWLIAGYLHAGEQTTFEFHSGFWVNLHHTLYNQAAGRKDGRVPDLSALTPSETAGWNEALDYYERNVAGHALLEFPMMKINRALSATAPSASRPAGEIPRPMIEVLEKAAPVYRDHWWPAHDRKNREWIDQVTPLIARYEAALRPALAHAYNTPWPKGRMRVEMSYYTTGAAAYTSLRPTLITISSWSQRNVGPAALETVFHEASHALIHRVQDEIRAAEHRQGHRLAHADFWHGVLFYTNSELVRQLLPAVEPYAVKYGLWEANWPNSLPVMEKDWRPFLEGQGRFRDSIDRLVADID